MMACRTSTFYFNLPEVRSAIHAEPLQTTGMWLDCTNRVSYTKEVTSTIPAHQYLLAQGTMQAAVAQAEAGWKLDCCIVASLLFLPQHQDSSTNMWHRFKSYVVSDLWLICGAAVGEIPEHPLELVPVMSSFLALGHPIHAAVQISAVTILKQSRHLA